MFISLFIFTQFAPLPGPDTMSSRTRTAGVTRDITDDGILRVLWHWRPASDSDSESDSNLKCLVRSLGVPGRIWARPGPGGWPPGH
jgi:hypothetical protein